MHEVRRRYVWKNERTNELDALRSARDDRLPALDRSIGRINNRISLIEDEIRLLMNEKDENFGHQLILASSHSCFDNISTTISRLWKDL